MRAEREDDVSDAETGDEAERDERDDARPSDELRERIAPAERHADHQEVDEEQRHEPEPEPSVQTFTAGRRRHARHSASTAHRAMAILGG